MTNGRVPGVCLACLLGVIALAVGSCIYIETDDYTASTFAASWPGNARAERQVEVSAPLGPGETFTAQSKNGSIAFDGQETGACRVVATIRTHARTEERAWELAEQIQVRLEPSRSGLTVVIDKPAVIRDATFGVSLDIVAPRQANLELVTDDGSIHVRNVRGTISARTSDGSIDVRNTEGDMALKTSDGSIHLNRVRAESVEARTSDGSIRGADIAVAHLVCDTSDGSIDLALADDSPTAPQILLTTSDGGITLITPPGLSAKIDASVSDGTIHTDLPLTIQGRVGRSLRATAGDGDGTSRLKTSDGSITIR